MKMPGITELVLILAIALIIFGPRKLPEIGRSIGRGIREFRSATTDVKKSISLDEDEDEDNRVSSKAGEETASQGTSAEESVVQGNKEKEAAAEEEAAGDEDPSEAKKEEQKV